MSICWRVERTTTFEKDGKCSVVLVLANSRQWHSAHGQWGIADTDNLQEVTCKQS